MNRQLKEILHDLKHIAEKLQSTIEDIQKLQKACEILGNDVMKCLTEEEKKGIKDVNNDI